MRKLLLAIVALGALAWSETASALVQTTDESFLNKGMPVAGGTATLNFNTPATASAPKRTIVHVVVRIKKTGHATVRTDTMQVQKGTGMTVDVVVTTDDGQTFTITDVPVETFYGVIEVGGGGGGPGMQFGGPFMPMLPPGGHPSGLSISSRWSGVYSRATLIEKDAVSNVATGLFEQFNTVGRVGVGASWAGLPSILGVSLVPFFSYDHLNQDLTQNFGSGCICEEILGQAVSVKRSRTSCRRGYTFRWSSMTTPISTPSSARPGSKRNFRFSSLP